MSITSSFGLGLRSGYDGLEEQRVAGGAGDRLLHARGVGDLAN